MDSNKGRGVSDLWNVANHIALVVSDVGRSLAFYTDVVGMKQVIRPDFDRHGAWLTFGNIDLHLIKGRPAVHADHDLIVSHISITITDMPALRKRLDVLGVKSRKNISVPNPGDSDTGRVDQAFVRDPDGYYIEFCNCDKLEDFLNVKAAEDVKKWNMFATYSVLTTGEKMRKISMDAKNIVEASTEIVAWPDLSSVEKSAEKQADKVKLINLVDRRKIYGDIAQNASEKELEQLLIYFDNDVPKVVGALESRVQVKGSRTLIPPAFFGRNGEMIAPPPFEIPAKITNDGLVDYSVEPDTPNH